MYRAFRRRHNDLKINESFVDDVLRMQFGYLDRYRSLPRDLQVLHIQMMNQLTQNYDPSIGWDNDWKYLRRKYENAFKAYHL